MLLDPEVLASMGLVKASQLDAPEVGAKPSEEDRDDQAGSGSPRALPWSESRRARDQQRGAGVDSLFEPAGSRSMKSLAQRQREVADAEAVAAGKPRWRPPSQAKQRPGRPGMSPSGKGKPGKGGLGVDGWGASQPGSESGPVAGPPAAPAWADVGAPPAWATDGDLPQRVTDLLEAWDEEESRAAELIAAGQEVLPEEEAEPKPPPEPLTPSEAEQLARAVALRLLTAMPRTRFELSKKLAERDVPAQAIEVVLDRFEELKLIDDQAFAAAWVESRSRSKGFARSRLKQELLRKGVSAQDLEPALDQVDSDVERARCQELALKKLGTRCLPPAGPGQADRAERDKILRRVIGFLARKGYPGGMAMSAARSAMDQHDQGERG